MKAVSVLLDNGDVFLFGKEYFFWCEADAKVTKDTLKAVKNLSLKETLKNLSLKETLFISNGSGNFTNISKTDPTCPIEKLKNYTIDCIGSNDAETILNKQTFIDFVGAAHCDDCLSVFTSEAMHHYIRFYKIHNAFGQGRSKDDGLETLTFAQFCEKFNIQPPEKKIQLEVTKTEAEILFSLLSKIKEN